MRTPKCSSQWTPTSIYLDIIILVSAQPQPYPGKRWMPYWWLWATTFIDYIVASATEDENLKRTDSAIWLSCENRKMSFFSERWLNATDLFLTRMVNNKIRKIFLPSKHTSTNKCFGIMFFSRFGRSLQFFYVWIRTHMNHLLKKDAPWNYSIYSLSAFTKIKFLLFFRTWSSHTITPPLISLWFQMLLTMVLEPWLNLSRHQPNTFAPAP